MKTKKAIGVALALAFAVSFGYLLGYQHGTTSARGRIAAVSSLRQIGLSFRSFRNDFGPFTVTGNVAIPKAEER